MNDEKNLPSTADHVGEAAGGITGAMAGAAIGVTAGPIGVLLGGIAGAIGGWWSGRAIAEAAEDITEADEQYYRSEVERDSDRRHRDRREGLDEAQAAYYLGHVAAANPEYRDRPFEDIEGDLSRGWTGSTATNDAWETVRPYASAGFARGSDRRRTPRVG